MFTARIHGQGTVLGTGVTAGELKTDLRLALLESRGDGPQITKQTFSYLIIIMISATITILMDPLMLKMRGDPGQGICHVHSAGQCWSWSLNCGHLASPSPWSPLGHSWGQCPDRSLGEGSGTKRVVGKLGQRSKWPHLCSFHRRTRAGACRFHCLSRHSSRTAAGRCFSYLQVRAGTLEPSAVRATKRTEECLRQNPLGKGRE